jgi:hypothetical protein
VSGGDQTPFSIEVQLNVDASNGDLGELAYQWLDSVSAALAPDERAELASAPARLGPPGPDVPGEVFGRLDFQHFDADLRNRRRGEWVASTAGLELLHRELARQCRSATLQLTRVPEPDQPSRWVMLKTAMLPESPGWLRVYANVPALRFWIRWRAPTCSGATATRCGHSHKG